MASANRPLLHALLEDRHHVAHPANTQAAAGQPSAAPFVSPLLRPAAAVQDPQLSEALTAAAVQPTVILAAPSEVVTSGLEESSRLSSARAKNVLPTSSHSTPQPSPDVRRSRPLT